MGNTDSMLNFKQGIFRLCSAEPIPADDPYWRAFYELPNVADDVFTLFTAGDIRRARDASLKNIETLVYVCIQRLTSLASNRHFPHAEAASDKQALNCIRILTRLLPFIYESEALDGWENAFFWEKRKRRKTETKAEVLFDETVKTDESLTKDVVEEIRPLGEELVDVLVDLLFYANFTVPPQAQASSKVTHAIWHKGVGCTTAMPATKEMENNRIEVSRLILTIASKSLYLSPNVLPVNGTKGLTYFVTCPDKQVVLSMLCSQLNTVLAYNPATWRVPYDHVVMKDSQELLVIYSLHLLLAFLLYPVPESSGKQSAKNYFRYFLGRIHRLQDMDFMATGMMRILRYPLQASSSYLPGSQREIHWTPEIIMLFWETLQCNKRFRSFIIDGERGLEMSTLMLFYALRHRHEQTQQGVVRMCVFVLQTMSTEPNYGKLLNRPFESHDTLPALLKLNDFHGTYADYFLIMLTDLINSGKGRLDSIYPSLLATINNVAPFLENLSAQAGSRLLQLFIHMSSPVFLLANETNHTLVHALMTAINAILEHQYENNRLFVRAAFRYRKGFESLRSFSLESGQEEIERINMHRKDSGQPISLIHDGSRNAGSRTANLSHVPENGTFAIGDEDEDSDEADEAGPHGTHHRRIMTPQSSTPSNRTSRNPSISSSSAAPTDDMLPSQARGMSEKARGKLPSGHGAFSRTNSATSLPMTPTSPQLGIPPSSDASHLSAFTPGPPSHSFIPTAAWVATWLPTLPLHTVLTLLSSAASPPKSLPSSIEPSPPLIQSFEWTSLSLGWYESLLWGFIFSAEMSMKGGAVGVWNGTALRLLKVQIVDRATAKTPTLLKPMGAVDAVGSRLVSGIGSLGFGASGKGSSASATSTTGGRSGRSSIASDRPPTDV